MRQDRIIRRRSVSSAATRLVRALNKLLKAAREAEQARDELLREKADRQKGVASHA